MIPHIAEIDDATWQVPAFVEHVLAPRAADYALVIPVINEGSRIQEQLSRIQAAGLSVDVIVADGGSTDGSLEPDFLKQVGVRALLVKTGPGKLSAQLRTAYAWCLRQGYAGIITIDGNGKDSVDTVTRFVEHLKQGADYVQGSRYAPGGGAENTPLERTIGNRLIHAPLLSLSGRRWLSDTTNGFRGYSARYLLHPGVQPFRDVFMQYELLFYLTVRAGQLGLNVVEQGVRRSYPKDQPTPTKISGWRGKRDLLGQTIKAAAGKYHPK
ncbi:Polyprenol monophosphomannose synthase (plasmid) [Roseobacter fucihabitans]|uniref:Polyprenol monophosphomannose synthase n=1 Tax=Roseobacter fucihabitans TaxID=1537242 RepID=A0ABZ2C2H4_9RHOB|nr:glycosyltransferase family 2 protein [Roseobacter litoralis]MBC6966895.1 Undecaprenyl-phosphate mannosyltransferase [Roseobacter litoralis]